MNGWILDGRDEVPIGRLILGEDLEDGPLQTDRLSQWATSMELLFSGTEVSDEEFDSIGQTLFLLETKVRQDLIDGFARVWPKWGGAGNSYLGFDWIYR